MYSQRFYGCLLVIVQAAAIGYLSNTVVFPVLVVLACVAAFFYGGEWKLTRSNEIRLYVSIVVLLVSKSFFAPHRFGMNEYSILTVQAYGFAQALVVCQCVLLLRITPESRQSPLLPGLAAAVLACAFNLVLYDSAKRTVCQVFVIAYLIVTALYLGAGAANPLAFWHRGRLLRSGTALLAVLLACGVGWASSSALYRFEHKLDELLIKIISPRDAPSRVGYSGRANLNSVTNLKSANSMGIALRIESDDEPGYLRGKVFETYSRGEWQPGHEARTLVPLDTMPPNLPMREEGWKLFEYEPANVPRWASWTCWPDQSLQGTVFTPLGCTHVATDTVEMTVSPHGLFASRDLPAGYPYAAYASTEPSLDDPPTPAQRERLTTVPGQLDPQVRNMVMDLVAECRTNQEKMIAVAGFLQQNYEYGQFNAAVPRGRDPIEHFLVEQSPAHCEFFASAAALMLRYTGVPTRYVTGFVVTEQNSFGDSWIARNRNAHAWVEGYDETAGWVTVEATPASGIATESQATDARQFFEDLWGRVREFRIRFQQGGVRWLMQAMTNKLISVPGMAILFMAASWLAYRKLRRMRAERTSRPRRDPLVDELQKVLARMDRRLVQLEIVRHPGETLHQFARRIAGMSLARLDSERVADWYRQYATVRYQGAVDPESVAGLRTSGERLR